MMQYWEKLQNKARRLTYLSSLFALLSAAITVYDSFFKMHPAADGWSATTSIIAAGLALLAVIQQNSDGKVYELNFLESDWMPNTAPVAEWDNPLEYVFTVPAAKHKNGTAAQIIVELANGESIFCDKWRSPNGDVLIGSGSRMCVHLKIK